MNRLISRPWFFPGLGTILYLAGFNDAALEKIGDGWLELGRVLQTIIVIVLLALIAYLVVDKVRERRSAYQTAIRAAGATYSAPTTVEAMSTGESVA